MSRKLAVLAALLLVLPMLACAATTDSALKRIQDSKTLRIAYRTDALPFSFEKDKEPAGYTVDLCKRIAASLEQQLKVKPLAVKWVPATSENRLELVRKGQVDMECGSTTATLSRMELVDFSSPVFVDTTALLVRKSSGARSLGGLADKKIAVVGGTSNQRALEAALKSGLVNATVVTVKDREEGVAALEAGTVDALSGDRVLLSGLGSKVKDASLYALLDDELGFEPYAIVLPRGEASLRLAVNRALAQIYSSEAIVQVFGNTFGSTVKPGPALVIMYGLNAYPE